MLDMTIMSDVGQIVYFDFILDHGIPERTPIHCHIGSNLDTLTDLHRAKMREADDYTSLFIHLESKAIPTDGTVWPNPRPCSDFCMIDHRVWTDGTTCLDCNMRANHNTPGNRNTVCNLSGRVNRVTLPRKRRWTIEGCQEQRQKQARLRSKQEDTPAHKLIRQPSKNLLCCHDCERAALQKQPDQ